MSQEETKPRTDADDLINPVQATEYAPGHFSALTKREHFASLILAEMGNPTMRRFARIDYGENAEEQHYLSRSKVAIAQADALIVELNKGIEAPSRP